MSQFCYLFLIFIIPGIVKKKTKLQYTLFSKSEFPLKLIPKKNL